MHIVDRRLNPGGKSLVNRQRFLRRAKALVQQAVRDSLKDRSIKDLETEGEVTIPRDEVHEPSFRRGSSGGNREHILPGNKEYLQGDEIERPPSGGEGAGGHQGEGDDEFRFVLSREEFLDLFLDDLELPELAKKKLTSGEAEGVRQAGYSTSGSPSALSITRTMRNSMSRRIALKRPRGEEMAKIEAEIARLEALPGDHSDAIAKLREELERLERRRKLITYVDPIDLRYRRFEPTPKPISQAVMFCLMDVSGSMTEHMKDLAKRFYALLHLFLKRCYRHVEVVFIRHTDRAEEVDEETFFYSRETGGTLVSTALEKMLQVMKDRYSPNDWNIYVAQASDGDNMPSDTAKTIALMADEIMPVAQYVAYLEVGREEDPMMSMGGPLMRASDLWRSYGQIDGQNGKFVMRKVHHRREIYPVFRELFAKRGLAAGRGKS
ncbi:YeaH/YhbH family protein [Novosphingobium sp. JCM 18896]|uniref:YeaH/YhbH family protein n=1 Tax=Novosphingobium sp. JCM 18896 TaxID=2989731 RepID=UPI0022219B68|nr:YeaH/YhbH family protein [Novosphingobium sp. JCM 18896]MCW1428997.1 YeaH/YhbH family protein [Novosphingobium sp. JCM 18896]